ncbi:hypothetical protein ACIQW9_12945 [Herminiimonas sp. NPDC097707]|uniref:hypothetical protein n=1 Tax=Herminiimonas sp. NPDC097707 TaxID=3364007 RepID=UPI00383AD1C8
MNSSDLVSDLREGLIALKAKGMSEIPIVNIEAYLNEVEKSIKTSAADSEQERAYALKKWELDTEVWKVNAGLQSDQHLEMFKSVIEAGGTALKSAMLINGGAAIALLAFLGNLLTRQPHLGDSVIISKLNYAMMIFVCGVGCAALATAARYLAQVCYAEFGQTWGGKFRIVAIVFALASFSSFFYGGVSAYGAMSR